jgi:hypothetical protein
LSELRTEEVQVIAVIVLLMRAMSEKSPKDLQRALGCSDQETQKLGSQISATVIAGSNGVWKQNTHEMQAGTEDEANIMIREEARRLEGADIEKGLVTEADE